MRQSCLINSTDVGSWLAWEAVTTEVRKSTCARKYLQGQATIKTWAQHTVRFITLSMMVVLYWPTRSAGIFDSGACLQFWFWGISGLDWVRFGRNLSRFLGWAWLFPHRWWGQGFFQGRRRCWLLCSRFWNSNVYGEKNETNSATTAADDSIFDVEENRTPAPCRKLSLRLHEVAFLVLVCLNFHFWVTGAKKVGSRVYNGQHRSVMHVALADQQVPDTCQHWQY